MDDIKNRQPAPAMAETIPGLSAELWYGDLLPAGAPDAVVERLNSAILTALHQPEVHQKLVDLGFNPVGSKPKGYITLVRSEMVKWTKVVKTSGARVD